MIDGKNNILAYFDSLNNPYFSIFQKGKSDTGNTIYRNDRETDATVDFTDGRAHFNKMLHLLSQGEYTLITSAEKGTTKRGGNRVDFRISIAESNNFIGMPAGAAVSGTNASGGLTMEDVIKMSDERFHKLTAERELATLKVENEALKKEVKELEKSKTDPWNKFITAAAPHADAIISGFTGQKTVMPVLSGVKPDAVSGADPDGQKVCEEFISALAELEPTEWKQTLIKLTDLIKNNPSKFELAKTFL